MSLWKFGDFEADVDFTDADFLDAIDEAKAAMHEAKQNVPVVGKNSDIIRAQCACFYVFFDTLFGEGAGERILCGKNSIKLCNEASKSLLDFETAEAKGISKKQIIFKHAFKNAIIPVITVMSIQIGAMVVGSVLVENVFALPGLGSLLINAINTSDYPIVQSVMLLLVAVFLILNLIVDIIYAIIDPRIRY